MKLFPWSENRTSIAEAREFLAGIIEKESVVSKVAVNSTLDGTPSFVIKEKWACEQYVILAIQQNGPLSRAMYNQLVNIMNTYGGSVLIVDDVLHQFAKSKTLKFN